MHRNSMLEIQAFTSKDLNILYSSRRVE